MLAGDYNLLRIKTKRLLFDFLEISFLSSKKHYVFTNAFGKKIYHHRYFLSP